MSFIIRFTGYTIKGSQRASKQNSFIKRLYSVVKPDQNNSDDSSSEDEDDENQKKDEESKREEDSDSGSIDV